MKNSTDFIRRPLRTTVIAVLIAFVVAVVTVLICLGVTTQTGAVGTLRRVIAIDAGHGGMDGGTVGVVTGNKESDLNLSLAFALQSTLNDSGLDTAMTRTTKDGLYGDLSPGFKRRDMQARAKVINDCAPCVTVSIHMNKYPLPSRRGAQVYYQKGDQASLALAQAVQSTLNAEINLPEGGRPFSALTGDFYLCRTSPCPTIIIECGFLSNPTDDRLLATDKYRARLATAIKNGIAEYLALMTVAP